MLPKSCLNRAIEDTYSFLRLSICVNSKRVEIDNSRMENTIRSLVLKRKNYLLYKNDVFTYKTYSLITAYKYSIIRMIS